MSTCRQFQIRDKHQVTDTHCTWLQVHSQTWSNLHVSTMQPAPALKYTSCTNSYIHSPASKHDTSCGSLLSSLTRLGCNWNTVCVCHLCQHQLCHNTVNYLLLEDSMQWHAHRVFPHDSTTALFGISFLEPPGSHTCFVIWCKQNQISPSILHWLDAHMIQDI